jgi:hypothetical protein
MAVATGLVLIALFLVFPLDYLSCVEFCPWLRMSLLVLLIVDDGVYDIIGWGMAAIAMTIADARHIQLMSTVLFWAKGANPIEPNNLVVTRIVTSPIARVDDALPSVLIAKVLVRLTNKFAVFLPDSKGGNESRNDDAK